MGLMKLFSKSTPNLVALPSGSFSVDREGSVLIGTLPSTFPDDLVHEIGQQVLAAFREAAKAQIPLSELSVDYTSLKISARELRGGALVFLTPRTPYAPGKSS